MAKITLIAWMAIASFFGSVTTEHTTTIESSECTVTMYNPQTHTWDDVDVDVDVDQERLSSLTSWQ